MMTDKDTYKILGIDPGTNVLGYAIINIQNDKIEITELGEIKLSHLPSHHFKLEKIYQKITKLIKLSRPNTMSIEAPFYGKNIQSMLKLGRAQGVAIAAGMSCGLTISEYAPKKIKLAITGNGNASKEQVAGMLASILNKKLDGIGMDATDALATAVCHYYQSNGLFTSGKKYKDWSSFAKDNASRISKG